MFTELLQSMVGTKITAHGERWIVLHHVKKDLYLAVRQDASLPVQVMLVKEDPKPEEGSDGPKDEQAAE